MSRAGSLRTIVSRLARLYGSPPPPFPTEPFELIVFENVAYLADDEKRRKAFELLRASVGTEPSEILRASPQRLLAVTAHGILSCESAEKILEAARIARDDHAEDLDAVVRLPVREAKRALRRFPGIGEPGAEKILLFTRSRPLLAPDSNALRVLVRLGLCADGKSYAATYAEARELAAAQLGDDFDRLLAAHQLLRTHGKELCKRAAPACERCPLAAGCKHASA